MVERVYTDHPELYDAIQSDWDYDRDVAFVRRVARERDVGDRLLEVGCGTGEHACRLLEAGFEVTAVDKHEGMLERAREKCDADFHRQVLPDLELQEPFDLIVAIRGVINHLPPSALEPAVEAFRSVLVPGGVLIVDNAPLPPSGNHPAMDVGTVAGDDYVRIAQHVAQPDGTLDWRAATWLSDGTFFVNRRAMTPFADDTVAETLTEAGLAVERHEGYGDGDDRTVFVARARTGR